MLISIRPTPVKKCLGGALYDSDSSGCDHVMETNKMLQFINTCG